MSFPQLNQSQESALLQASSDPVLAALGGANVVNNGSWLSPMHPLGKGVDKSHNPFGGGSTLPQHVGKELAEYLAAASPTHCTDGWSYLARSMSAYLLGDAHSAWHLAYYAELRAAQSLLSSLGCGAFNEWNCVLNAQGMPLDLSKGQTHTMVWAALSTLALKSPVAWMKVSAPVQVFGTSLPELVIHAFPGTSTQITTSQWVSDWLFDLEDSHDDKRFRNKCSYSPHELTPHYARCNESIKTASLLWQLLEPTPGSPFFRIDCLLLRGAIRDVAQVWLNNAQSGGAQSLTMDKVIADAYSRLVSAVPAMSQIGLKYFTEVNQPEDELIFHAQDRSVAPDTPRSVIARAFLLLRLATGTAASFIKASSKEREVGALLDRFAIQCGLAGDLSDLPDDRSDLFSDSQLAISDAMKICAATSGKLAALLNDTRTKVHTIAGFDRVVQWSLAQ